jgi:4-diphosphocytidyl-2-C-methyl-D-erythritol kinase
MPLTLRSFAKINLGLQIGALRPDGFHELRTVYQTIALHDMIRVRVERGTGTEIRCEDPRVPKDKSNTCYRVVERAIAALGARCRVVIEIEKRLPVQGGLGGASGNAVASLLALERTLKKRLPGPERLRIASEVGSDVPLFLVGGTVLGIGRGEEVYPLPDLPSTACVVAIPEIGVSTPQAFADWGGMTRSPQGLKPSSHSDLFGTAEAVPFHERARDRAGHEAFADWDAMTGRPQGLKPSSFGAASGAAEAVPFHGEVGISAGASTSREANISGSTWDTEKELAERRSARTGEGARPHMLSADSRHPKLTVPSSSDRMNEFSRIVSAWLSGTVSGVPVSKGRGRAETPLLDLVRTGIENDFERVVFPKYPELREVKRVLERAGAFYASLSGSGSAIYGLFVSRTSAEKAAAKIRKQGIRAITTSTLTRRQYWKKIFD